jgi:ABC-2 type transport system permease protein
VKALAAQIESEVYMTLRRGETLLLTIGIPVAFLVFFTTVHVVTTGARHPVTFFVPGVLALAVMSTAMVSLGIATGFERGYGVLKRLGATPLGRPRLIAAKIATVVLVELVQAAVLVPVGYGLGWHPPSGPAAIGGAGTAALEALAVALLATVGFGGLGLLLAGVLKAELNLAVANALYLVLLLAGGMVVPVGKLPSGLQTLARALPAAALSDGLHAALGSGAPVPLEAWVVLAVWAVAAPLVAAATFRWE